MRRTLYGARAPHPAASTGKQRHAAIRARDPRKRCNSWQDCTPAAARGAAPLWRRARQHKHYDQVSYLSYTLEQWCRSARRRDCNLRRAAARQTNAPAANG